MTTTAQALWQEEKATQFLNLCATGANSGEAIVKHLDVRAVKRVLVFNGFAYLFVQGLIALIPVAIPTRGNLAGQIEAMFILWLLITTAVVGVSAVPLQRLWHNKTALLAIGNGMLAIRDRGTVRVWDLSRLRPEVTAYTQHGKVGRVAVWNDKNQAETVLNHEAFGDLSAFADALTSAIRRAAKE